MHGSRRRRQFDSKEGWRGSRGEKKTGNRGMKAKEEIKRESESIESQQARQLFAVKKLTGFTLA